MKMLAVLLSFLMFSASRAQVPVTPSVLGAKADAIIKSAMRVLDESDGILTLSFPGNSFAPKTPLLFFRKKNTRIEMIASGQFLREQKDPKTGKKVLICEISRDTINKYPTKGDYAVPMTEPGDPKLDSNEALSYRPPLEQEDRYEENTRPGYFEPGLGLMTGSIQAKPSSGVNVSKSSSSYRFQTIHFAYYSHFIPFGVEYDQHSGNFPTRTYFGTVIQSSETVSTLNFAYRFKPLMNRKLAISTRLSLLNDQFTTNNVDISLINTKISATGLGIKGHYDFVSPIWRADAGEFPIQLQGFGAEFFYYPLVSATDTNTISRGTSSSGSSALQYRFSVTALAWIPFIPIFKRWVFQTSYGARHFNLKFNGTTVGEPSNPEPVPQNSTSSESESDFRFFFGFRIEDPVKLIFFGDRSI